MFILFGATMSFNWSYTLLEEAEEELSDYEKHGKKLLKGRRDRRGGVILM